MGYSPTMPWGKPPLRLAAALPCAGHQSNVLSPVPCPVGPGHFTCGGEESSCPRLGWLKLVAPETASILI